MPDVLRLAVGTLTRLPVPAPRRIDRQVAGSAMLLAPFVGAVLALAVGLATQVAADRLPASVPPLLLAALAVAALAWLTRALHLDGLADTADALGSGRPADQALAIARRSDIGPFGVVTLVLVLLVQVAALSGLVADGRGLLGLVVAAGTARLGITMACARGIPAARPDGLGAAVAGTVPVAAAIAVGAIWLGACAAVTAVLLPGAAVAVTAAIAGAMLAAAVVLIVCTRRLGGITGDVLGAIVELTFTVGLVILVAVPS